MVVKCFKQQHIIFFFFFFFFLLMEIILLHKHPIIGTFIHWMGGQYCSTNVPGLLLSFSDVVIIVNRLNIGSYA